MGGSRGDRARNLEVVRRLWAAIRDHRPADADDLLHPDVEWFPALLATAPLRGRAAVREQLERVADPDAVMLDPQPFSFEPVGRDGVLVSGALRVRRPDGHVTTHLRWWVYRLQDRKIIHAANHSSRESALAAAREPTTG